MDLPATVEIARAALANAGLADRTTCVAGDMFKSVPAADTYLLKWILHDWKDAECVQILKCIRAAIKPGGRVLAIDCQRPAAEAPSMVHMMDMQMFTQTTGRERSAAEMAEIYSAAGFRQTRVIAYDETLSMTIFEGTPI